MASDEQAVGVDAVGSAGNECYIILARNYLQIPCVGRQNRLYLIDLVSEDVVKNIEIESVADFNFIEIGE